MAEYHDESDSTLDRRGGGAGRLLLIIAVIAALVAGVLFATGFWTVDVKKGALPDVDVRATGGEMPAVDVRSKEVVVGTKKESINVPTVGVKDKEDGKGGE